MSGGKREGKGKKVLNNASFLPFLYLMLFLLIFFLVFCFPYFFLPAVISFWAYANRIHQRGCTGAVQTGHQITPSAKQCAWATQPHQHKQTPIIYTPDVPVKRKKNIFFFKDERNEKEEKSSTLEREKKEERKKKEFSIRSILTRATMYIQSACSFPQFPAGFQKAHHTHTHIGKPSRKIKKIKLYNDSCLFFFCATTTVTSEYKITTQSAKRHNGAPNSI